MPRPAYHLAPFVGDAKSFSEPSNRYLRFTGSGLNLGKASLCSWDFMRAEVGDASGSIFEAPAKDAPGRPTAMEFLDPAGSLRQAWDIDIPGNFFTSLPAAETRGLRTWRCAPR